MHSAAYAKLQLKAFPYKCRPLIGAFRPCYRSAREERSALVLLNTPRRALAHADHLALQLDHLLALRLDLLLDDLLRRLELLLLLCRRRKRRVLRLRAWRFF